MRHFTIGEANDMLATVRPIVEGLVAHRRILARNQDELGRLRSKAAGNGGGLDAGRVASLEAAAADAAREIGQALETLDAMGVQVKDLDRGLIDFPAVHPASGATVLLCWHLGEPRIDYWHDLDAGFAGRKRLPF